VASPEPVRRPAEVVRPQEVSRRLQGLATTRQLGYGEGWEHPRAPWAAERLSVQASENQRPSVHNVVIQRSHDSPSVNPSEPKRVSVHESQPEGPLCYPSTPQRTFQQNGLSRPTQNQRTMIQLFIQGKQFCSKPLCTRMNYRIYIWNNNWIFVTALFTKTFTIFCTITMRHSYLCARLCWDPEANL
jgi:hypothetical protein